jgi:hypothetical protein
MPRAPFITFEGIEGAGKTTLAHHLADWLQAQGMSVRLTREPGGSTLGAHLRPILLNEPLDAWTELFLFLADRRQHTLQLILPALEQGTWVLCDRYADSTLVYQGYGRGLDIALIRRLNALATRRPHARPDRAHRPACGGRPRPCERAQPLRGGDAGVPHAHPRGLSGGRPRRADTDTSCLTDANHWRLAQGSLWSERYGCGFSMGEPMRVKHRHHQLSREIQQWISDYLGGRCTRAQMAEWASNQLRSIPNSQLEGTPYGELMDYILCRFTDDDWTDEEEYRNEMCDLLSRLQRAEQGEIVLP